MQSVPSRGRKSPAGLCYCLFYISLATIVFCFIQVLKGGASYLNLLSYLSVMSSCARACVRARVHHAAQMGEFYRQCVRGCGMALACF